MDKKTKAFLELAGGIILLIVAISLGVYLSGIVSAYSLFTQSDAEALLKWGFSALLLGFMGGVSITKAYFSLKSPTRTGKP